jgi:hypothetical protein
VTKQVGIVYHIVRDVSLYADYSDPVKPQTTIAYDQYGNSNFPADKHYVQGAQSANELVPGEQRLITLSFEARF